MGRWVGGSVVAGLQGSRAPGLQAPPWPYGARGSGAPGGVVAGARGCYLLENYSYQGWFSNIEIRGFTRKGGSTGLVELMLVDYPKQKKRGALR